jgi:ABC-type multidrug transport system fused ATPase/permease subunit
VGVATISGSDASEALVLWPGAIAYVPQEVAVAGGSVRSNVALGLPDELIDDSLVEEALKQAHLWRFLSTSAEGIFTQVGERGLRLSGGQRQRLGIARALYTRPRLIILDEATSALDADTEESITQTIQSLGPNITTVVIAHRLSTVRAVDALAYLERGRIVARGTFDELKESIPTFARQAHLLGL